MHIYEPSSEKQHFDYTHATCDQIWIQFWLHNPVDMIFLFPTIPVLCYLVLFGRSYKLHRESRHQAGNAGDDDIGWGIQKICQGTTSFLVLYPHLRVSSLVCLPAMGKYLYPTRPTRSPSSKWPAYGSCHIIHHTEATEWWGVRWPLSKKNKTDKHSL